MQLIRIINRITPPFLWDIARDWVGHADTDSIQPFVHDSVRSYSQYGEDLVLDALLGCQDEGFYVDIGANDPEVLSNTLRFYQRGWHGINVEPNSVLADEFRRRRPDDINLNVGIASQAGDLTFYRMEPSTLSTFDQDAVTDNLEHPGARLIEETRVAVEPLTRVLDAHLDGRSIDFLSVDTEGFDLFVLQSNDWLRYRPRLVLVEVAWKPSEIVEYLGTQGYVMVWSNGVNGIFADDDQPLGPQI